MRYFARTRTLHLIQFLRQVNETYSPSSYRRIRYTDDEKELANKTLSYAIDIRQKPNNFSKIEKIVKLVKFLKENSPAINKLQDKFLAIEHLKSSGYRNNLRDNLLVSYAILLGNNENKDMVYGRLTFEEALLFQNFCRDVMEDDSEAKATYDMEELDDINKKIDRIFSELKVEKLYFFTICDRMQHISEILKSSKKFNVDFHLTTDEEELRKKSNITSVY